MEIKELFFHFPVFTVELYYRRLYNFYFVIRTLFIKLTGLYFSNIAIEQFLFEVIECLTALIPEFFNNHIIRVIVMYEFCSISDTSSTNLTNFFRFLFYKRKFFFKIFKFFYTIIKCW